MGKIFTGIILSLLSLDTLRGIIAMLGWVKPESKYAWIVYGRYNKNIVSQALRDLGYSETTEKRIINENKELSKNLKRSTGIKANTAPIHLIILLSKYIKQFDSEISYGESSMATSRYYIDTMEISHNQEDLLTMNAIMHYLIKANHKKNKKIKTIITPKGGNPIFAQTVANNYNADLIICKSKEDKSRITSVTHEPIDVFSINFEGSWKLFDSNDELTSIIVDCNTTDGSQLLQIITELSEVLPKCKQHLKLLNPQEVYVLFCLNDNDIQENFNEREVKLFRYFDLDESAKAAIYSLHKKCEELGRVANYYNTTDREEAKKIIDILEANDKMIYKIKTQ